MHKVNESGYRVNGNMSATVAPLLGTQYSRSVITDLLP
jgi:hypothetical protein